MYTFSDTSKWVLNFQLESVVLYLIRCCDMDAVFLDPTLVIVARLMCRSAFRSNIPHLISTHRFKKKRLLLQKVKWLSTAMQSACAYFQARWDDVHGLLWIPDDQSEWYKCFKIISKTRHTVLHEWIYRPMTRCNWLLICMYCRSKF